MASCIMACAPVVAQTLDEGQQIEQLLRNKQLLGQGRFDQSFALRTIPFSADSMLEAGTFKRPAIRVLPISWLTQYNSRQPFGMNDGSLVQAKGVQTRISGGIQLKAGILELQVAPELVWAANPAYPTVNGVYGYNNGQSFQRIYAGQSTLQLTKGGFRAGISTANQWWGPGERNSLLMTYQAPGFLHAFIGSKRPLSTPIGSFEWKLMSGWLRTDGNRSMENRHLLAANPVWGNNKRYLNALTISYQPKWVPGLFLGFNRVIQTYWNDSITKTLGALERFVPTLALGGQKKNVANEDLVDRDQIASFFLRWVFPKVQAEFYLEYGFNDYGQNTRDYLLGPSHSAAHIAGFKKIIPQAGEGKWLDFTLEITKMSQTPDFMVRNAGNWYEHSQIFEGYTQDNQILGSVYGYGADAIFLGMNMVRENKRLGFYIEQINRDPIGRATKWIDLGFGFAPQWQKGSWGIGGKVEMIRSRGYAWQPGTTFLNLHLQMGLQYHFMPSGK
jgi:hypothetical protein